MTVLGEICGLGGRPRGETTEGALQQDLEAIYEGHPYYGSRRMRLALRDRGRDLGLRRIRRGMREMRLTPIHPARRTSVRAVISSEQMSGYWQCVQEMGEHFFDLTKFLNSSLMTCPNLYSPENDKSSRKPWDENSRKPY